MSIKSFRLSLANKLTKFGESVGLDTVPFLSSEKIKKELLRPYPRFLKQKMIQYTVRRLYRDYSVSLKIAIDELIDPNEKICDKSVENRMFVHNVALTQYMELHNESTKENKITEKSQTNEI